jgi:hypothetical protein
MGWSTKTRVVSCLALATLDMASTLIENEDCPVLRMGVFGYTLF